MKILAIEAACPPGAIAIVDENCVIGLRELENAQRTTETFATTIQSLLCEAGWSASDVDVVATSIGPGSFTGLRIGVTAAKVFAYAVGAKAIGVDTLELIAHQSAEDGEIEAVLDAQRGELFAARFHKRGERLEELIPTQIIHADRWLSTRASSSTVLIGPGLTKLQARIPLGSKVEDHETWRPRADCLGLIATAKLSEAVEADPWKLVPEYHRRSAAEEKADKA